MGCWGMGIAQSDEFCEVYERFMEKYNEGMEVSEITSAILAGYHKEFDDEDGILHDVYFALAKAEWMCCSQSPEILARVRTIIESGANIEFLRELEADEPDLKARRKNLDKFILTLNIPREKPKRRTPPPKKRTFQYMQLEKGDVFCYKSKNVLYGGIILEKIRGCCLVALTEALPAVPKEPEEVLCAPAFTAAWTNELLPESRMKRLGSVGVEGHYNGRAGWYMGEKGDFLLGSIGGFINNKVWSHEMNKGLYPGFALWDLLKPENIPAVVIPPHFQDAEYRKYILGKG